MKPDFEIRAVQLDLARQMETMDFIKNFIDFIAEKNYNTLFLYLEWRVRTATFDIGQENGYSAGEIREIVEYASARNIDVIPGLACLGHSELLLNTPGYGHLCELRNGITGRFWGSMQDEMCPSLPETRAFVEAYFTEVAAMFPSQYLHIGADEVYNMGYCKECAPKAGTFAGEQALYGDHIKFCHAFLTQKLKKRVMMWDDMIELYPEVFDTFPRDIIMVNWLYDPNITGWRGHFANLDFKDRHAYYEKAGFEYIIAPADYCWSNVETFTATVQNKKCKGGLLTIWEKKQRLMYKYFPIIAATGGLWSSSGEKSSEEIFHSALAELFQTDDELFLNAIEQYVEFYAKGQCLNAALLNTHASAGPDWEKMRSFRTMKGVLQQKREKFAGTFAGAITDDIIADIDMWEAGYRLNLAAFKMLHGQEAEDLDKIAGDISAVWDRNIEACKKARTAVSVEAFRGFKDRVLKMIDDFKDNFSTCARVQINFVLPDGYEAEKIDIRLKSGGKWLPVSSGVDKSKSALFHKYFFVPAGVVPEEIEIAAEGYGGIGIAYAAVFTAAGKYEPAGITYLSGEVSNVTNILTPDETFAYFGSQSTIDAYRNRKISEVRHTARIALKKAVPGIL
ncbi:MAG: family 20 glycosylhydrolase [Lentisphaeria bacterium]|nr:family 20 glycosylhydrolase [Lentisphaeria bacterium]